MPHPPRATRTATLFPYTPLFRSIATAPSVAYLVRKTDGTVLEVHNPADLPSMAEIEEITEPMLTCTLLTPKDYTGTIMDLCQTRRGEMIKLEYLSPERMELV